MLLWAYMLHDVSGSFFFIYLFFLDHIALTCADLVIETMRDKQKAKKQRAHTHTQH